MLQWPTMSTWPSAAAHAQQGLWVDTVSIKVLSPGWLDIMTVYFFAHHQKHGSFTITLLLVSFFTLLLCTSHWPFKFKFIYMCKVTCSGGTLYQLSQLFHNIRVYAYT